MSPRSTQRLHEAGDDPHLLAIILVGFQRSDLLRQSFPASETSGSLEK